MHGSIDVFLHQALAEQNRILIVVTLPSHKPNQRILAQGKLPVGGRGPVCDYLSLFHPFSLVHNGALVVAVRLVAAGKFR